MSVRYSSSPTLRLTIGKSRLRTVLYGALCLLTLGALCGIYARGYTLFSLVLTPLAAALLWHLWQDSSKGSLLCWQQGQWTLQRNTQAQLIVPTRRSTATPWVIYLAFDEVSSGRYGQLWLYADSVPAQQLRRLRVRLTLLR